MHIQQVDPHDDAAVAAWFGVVDAWQREARPEEPGWLLAEQQALLVAGSLPDADEEVVGLVAVEGGRVLGIGRLDLPRRDNLHLGDLLLITHPDCRRRGAARALVAEVEARLRSAGRTTLTATSEELPGELGRSVARAAGAALGFTLEQAEIRRDIDLPLPDDVVARVEAEAWPRAQDYTIRTWCEAVPEDLLEDQAHLLRRMSTDVPTAGLEWHEEVWDAERVRRKERQIAEMGRSWLGAGAIHEPTGRMVAYTTMGVAIAALERAYQWDTLVLEEHRGHRLGMLVKLVCLQRLSRDLPEVRFISTWNAAENAPMIRVNELLGARTNGQHLNWQKRL